MVVLGWSFWVASSIGSFLNVVAWRMPRGEGVGGRSYCPRCKSQLRAKDNFPVFGWLALGGRCRTCRLPISPRYPIVEAVVGTSLTIVAIGQLYRLSLPGQSSHWHGGPSWTPIIDQPMLVVLLFHVFALSVGWAMALIRYDKNSIPPKLTFVGLGIVVVAMVTYPRLIVVPWQSGPTSPEIWLGPSLYVNVGVRVLTSLVAAALIGRSLARAFCPAADPKQDPLGRSTRRLMDLIAIMAVPALIVGWQSSPAVAVVATLIAVFLRRFFTRSTDGLGAFALAIPVTLTLAIFAWRFLIGQAWWPSPANAGPWAIIGWSAAILLVPLWIRDREVARVIPPAMVDEDDETGEDEDDDDESPEPGASIQP
ncbi:Leader peptidase PppA [Rubripirellula tenax]|uniref:Leader peptidase PppA n=2 Tax=Rubripirellula tenax TaxID=2528015 RepID=A0A5C6FB51_9BACT|nr:Leader peptidase PppA [Rubripirellula tenax]